MKILCLYNNNCALELFRWIESQGHEIIVKSERLEADWCNREGFELAVSYTYRYILTGEVIKALHYNIVNLHNSYLPWNRGADPNLWSVREDSPRGVTLHYMNEKLDKGEIIVQELVPYDDEMSLHDSYYQLDRAAKEMFKKAFLYCSDWAEMKKNSVAHLFAYIFLKFSNRNVI